MTAGDLLGTPAGRVLDQNVDLADGRATTTVVADRPAMVMLKTTFDPRWQVTVDGVSVEPQMVAPSFVGREVPAGEHVIRFAYEPFPRYDVMLLIGGMTVLGLAVIPVWLRRRRDRSRDAPLPEGDVRGDPRSE